MDKNLFEKSVFNLLWCFLGLITLVSCVTPNSSYYQPESSTNIESEEETSIESREEMANRQIAILNERYEKQKKEEKMNRKRALAIENYKDLLKEEMKTCDIYYAISTESPVIFRELNPSTPNSAGGVDLREEFVNISDKTIKYVIIEAVPYNAVGDVVRCTIRNRSTLQGKITGPIQPRRRDVSVFENAWYNNTIRSIALTSLTVIFMDDKKITISDKEILESLIFGKDQRYFSFPLGYFPRPLSSLFPAGMELSEEEIMDIKKEVGWDDEKYGGLK